MATRTPMNRTAGTILVLAAALILPLLVSPALPQAPRAPEDEASPPPPAPPPTARAVFLAGLEALEGLRAPEFPDALALFVDERLAEGPGETPERARERRRALLTGLGALFDQGDTLRGIPVVGRSFDGVVETDEERRRRDILCDHARIHGRHDAPKHFFLAAALTVRGGPAAAAQASLAKEMEDARRSDLEPPQGSGFSFVDLGYDHAGIRFANWLLGWRHPERLGERPPRLERFLPAFPTLELPERIGWQRYCDEYRGERSEALLDTIHAAIDAQLSDVGTDEERAEREPGGTRPEGTPPTEVAPPIGDSPGGGR